jgi:hypothetical protein
VIVLGTVGVLGAVIDPERPAFWRIAVLLLAGIALGIAWRAPWPQLPELPIPVIMF